jgi:hypothetical protein
MPTSLEHSPIRMPEVPPRSDPVPHQLLQFLHLRKPLLLSPRPNDKIIHADFEDPASTRDKRHLPNLILKRRE